MNPLENTVNAPRIFVSRSNEDSNYGQYGQFDKRKIRPALAPNQNRAVCPNELFCLVQ